MNDRPGSYDLDLDSYFTPGSFRRARLGFIAATFGTLGAFAGYNAYERGASKLQATAHGAYCAMRWKVWAFTAFLWTATTMIWLMWSGVQGTPPPTTTGAGRPLGFQAWGNGQDNSFTFSLVLVNLLTFLPAVAVTYCQNVDESMFKRRFVYRALGPFRKLFGRMPWMVLHSVVLIPFFLMAIKYNA